MFTLVLAVALCAHIAVTDVVTATAEGFTCQRDVQLTPTVCGWHKGERWGQTLSYDVEGVPVRWRNEALYALATWGRLAGLRFVPGDDGIIIRFGRLPPGRLGEAHYPCPEDSAAGEITISATYDWVAKPRLLRLVLLHEIGHALGLAHSDDERSVMYYSIAYEEHFILQRDLIALRTLYGARTQISRHPSHSGH